MGHYRSRRSGVDQRKPQPSECPHCEFDRRFPGFEAGGWIQQDNNGPIVSCPMCNVDGSHQPAEGFNELIHT
jgi:hypothetical protein